MSGKQTPAYTKQWRTNHPTYFREWYALHQNPMPLKIKRIQGSKAAHVALHRKFPPRPQLYTRAEVEQVFRYGIAWALRNHSDYMGGEFATAVRKVVAAAVQKGGPPKLVVNGAWHHPNGSHHHVDNSANNKTRKR